MNLLGVFDCFGMVLCRRMVSLNEVQVQVHSGAVDVEEAGSGGEDMALDGRSECRFLDLERTIYVCTAYITSMLLNRILNCCFITFIVICNV